MPQVCHTHCPKGGWGWLFAVIVAAVVLLLGGRAAAPVLGRLVHDVLVWATVVIVGSGITTTVVYVTYSAVQDRRRRPGTESIPEGRPITAGHVPAQRGKADG